jgi:alanine dehydrogenase
MINIGVLRETDLFDARVALTPAVVRQLVEHGAGIWVETGAGNGAKFRDDDYQRTGARIAYSPTELIRNCELILSIAAPSLDAMDHCDSGNAVMSFFHLATAGKPMLGKLMERSITAIGCEIIETAGGRLPVLGALSEIAGQMTIPLAAHMLRSTTGGRGILLGGSPGLPPAQVVILGAGTVGTWAARVAVANGARVTVLDRNAGKLRRLMEHLPNVATQLSDPEAVAEAVQSADVVIGAVLIAGARTPHVVTREMVDKMKPGSVIIDVSIDQGGCVETSRPTPVSDPIFLHHGIPHYCVPNLTAEMGRSASIALSQGLLPYLLEIAEKGLERALLEDADLRRGVYTHLGQCVNGQLSGIYPVPCQSLEELLRHSHSA